MATTDGQGLYPLYTTQFSTNLELILQQQTSKLRGRVAEGSHVGKQASPIQQLGPVRTQAPAGRYAPKSRTDADFTRRWVFPQDRELDQLIDSFDELKTIVDPKSQYATGAAAACGRDWDDAIIVASTGTAYTGQDANGLTAETFSTASYQVASTFGSSAASGLTVAKMIELKRIFRHYHNDLEMDRPTLVIGSQQESDLLNQVQVVSTEFNDRPVLVDGQIQRFMGFDIVLSERLTWASNVRTCIAFVKSGMYLGIWKDMTNRISIRNDLSSEPFDLYTMHSYGATRTQPGKVLAVLCSDTTGADITP
jgi:hypothetical protein